MNARRPLALAGVALAALATLATSPKRWRFDDARSGTTVLDDAHPSEALHVTVHSTHPPRIVLEARSTWAARDLGASVRVSARPDDGSAPSSATAARLPGEGGGPAPQTAVALSLTTPACAGGCSAGYRIGLERIAGSGERVEVAWKIVGEVEGIGETPPGAGVVVRIDPRP